MRIKTLAGVGIITHKEVLLGLLFILALVSFSAAAVEIVPEQVILEADYGKFTDEDQTQIREGTSVQVRNTDPAASVNVTLSLVDLPASYNTTTVTPTNLSHPNPHN